MSSSNPGVIKGSTETDFPRSKRRVTRDSYDKDVKTVIEYPRSKRKIVKDGWGNI